MQRITCAMRPMKYLGLLAVPLLALLFTACGDDNGTAAPTQPSGSNSTATIAPTQPSGSNNGNNADLSGNIAIAGSSTVFPISEAMAEEFSGLHSRVRVNVASTGTGAGFRAVCAGEIQVSDASRPVKQEELDTCAANNIELIEVPVAFDALSVVVNNNNDWADCLTVEQLKTIWGPEAQGTITNWNQVEEGYPDTRLQLYGPTAASGTFDYFTEAIMGEAGAHRGDLDLATEDDPLIAQGVSGSDGAIGYFGLAYLTQYGDLVKPVAIANPSTGECVEPSDETVENGSYQPLARPIFIYVNKAALEQRPEVEAFVELYLEKATQLVPDVGYVAFPQVVYDWGEERVQSRTAGSVFRDIPPGTPIEEALSRIQ